MAANQLGRTFFIAKLAHTLNLAAITCLIFMGEFATTGLLMGFPINGLLAVLPRLIPLALALWAIAQTALWLGIHMTFFAGVMTTVLIIIAGLGLTLVLPQLAAFYPMSLMSTASGSRDAGSVTAMGSIALATGISLAWCLVLASGIRRVMNRVT